MEHKLDNTVKENRKKKKDKKKWSRLYRYMERMHLGIERVPGGKDNIVKVIFSLDHLYLGQ